MPDKIFKRNAKGDAASIVMGGGPALPYKAKGNMFSVPTNYGTASKPLYKKEAMSSPIPRTTEFKQTQTNAPAVEHGDGQTYSGTLYSYYEGKGIDMPSWQERGATYEQLKLGNQKDYKGTSSQNKAMYDKLTTDTQKIVKDNQGNIKSVVDSGAEVTDDGINVEFSADKTKLQKGSNVTEVEDITDENIKNVKERRPGRERRIARRHARRSKRRGTEVVETGGEVPIQEEPIGGDAAVLGQTSGAGSSMAVPKKKKYYDKKK